jgi:hypothetical protein
MTEETKTVHTSPEEVVGDHVDVIKDAISAPLPGGSSAPEPSEKQEAGKTEGKEKAA